MALIEAAPTQIGNTMTSGIQIRNTTRLDQLQLPIPDLCSRSRMQHELFRAYCSPVGLAMAPLTIDRRPPAVREAPATATCGGAACKLEQGPKYEEAQVFAEMGDGGRAGEGR